MCKKNESHWDNSLYIHVKYIENHCKIKDIKHFSIVIQSIKIIDLYPLYNSCIYILFNCIYHNKILKHTYPYILFTSILSFNLYNFLYYNTIICFYKVNCLNKFILIFKYYVYITIIMNLYIFY